MLYLYLYLCLYFYFYFYLYFYDAADYDLYQRALRDLFGRSTFLLINAIPQGPLSTEGGVRKRFNNKRKEVLPLRLPTCKTTIFLFSLPYVTKIHRNFWRMKTAPCGQDTTPYGLKPLFRMS